MVKKNSERCSGAKGYISWEVIFSFFDNKNLRPSNYKNLRPSNFLFQIARGSRATFNECTFSSKKRTSLKGLLQDIPLQDFMSKEPGTNLIHQAELEKQGGFQVQPWNARGLVDAEPIGSPAMWLRVVGPGLTHRQKQEEVQRPLHRIWVE
jgi:hypothetical protein